MGRSPCCIKEGLKKGPWTPEEDQKLTTFIKEHGHGNWRSLPKQCGLLRCGKSCRLRWTNYLRPDIKRGLFTLSEEQKIIQLHALVGNRWAFIASQLPRRTDNEIKNYWNTVLKKRLGKVGMLSQLAGGARTLSTLTPPKLDNKSINNSASKKPSSSSNTSSDIQLQGNTICSPSVMSCSHLAQWESARLEAEARLAKESQSSRTHKLLSFKYMGYSFSNPSNTTASTTTTSSSSVTTSTTSAFSSLSNHAYTDQYILQQLSNCLFNPAIQHPSTISSLSTTSNLSLPITSLSKTSTNSLSNISTLNLPSIVSMPSTCSASNNSSASRNIVSSKSLSRLSSQESIASALTLGPTGRLSWQTKELSFATSSPSKSDNSQSSLISEMLGIMNKDHGQEVEMHASTNGDLDPEELKAIRGNDQMNLEVTSSMVDLNRAMEISMDLNSTMDNWHDLLFDVENSCSDVVSTNWKDPILSSSEFTHDSASLINNISTKAGSLEGAHVSLHLEGFNLLHFDTLSKELLWDTPTTLSVSSSSIVN